MRCGPAFFPHIEQKGNHFVPGLRAHKPSVEVSQPTAQKTASGMCACGLQTGGGAGRGVRERDNRGGSRERQSGGFARETSAPRPPRRPRSRSGTAASPRRRRAAIEAARRSSAHRSRPRRRAAAAAAPARARRAEERARSRPRTTRRDAAPRRAAPGHSPGRRWGRACAHAAARGARRRGRAERVRARGWGVRAGAYLGREGPRAAPLVRGDVGVRLALPRLRVVAVVPERYVRPRRLPVEHVRVGHAGRELGDERQRALLAGKRESAPSCQRDATHRPKACRTKSERSWRGEKERAPSFRRDATHGPKACQTKSERASSHAAMIACW